MARTFLTTSGHHARIAELSASLSEIRETLEALTPDVIADLLNNAVAEAFKSSEVKSNRRNLHLIRGGRDEFDGYDLNVIIAEAN